MVKSSDFEEQLRRSVLSCLLFEDNFYEDGQSVADRIKSLIPKIPALRVAQIAMEARDQMKLRHVPLLIAREMARIETHKPYVARLLEKVIQRPDELAELLAIYWKDGKEKLSAQVKKGLAAAFMKFNEYSLAKYNNQDKAVKLRDVLFLCHAKPKDKEQEKLWERLIDNKLTVPDTWEVIISGAKANKMTKKEAWEKVIDVWTEEGKIRNHMAILRNLRNIQEAGVDKKHMDRLTGAFSDKSWMTSKVLPFRFISAARFAPALESDIEKAMLMSMESREKMTGETVILVDVSGSMDGTTVSAKSDITRIDAACGVSMLAREMFEKVRIFTFSNKLVEIPARHGFGLRDAIIGSQPHGGTELGGALRTINSKVPYDRIIIVTDEQQTDSIPLGNPKGKGYIVNVAIYENGVGYGRWTHINGWSEAILDYIKVFEEGMAGTKDYIQELLNPVSKDAKVYTGEKKRTKHAKSGSKKACRDSGKRVQRNRKSRTRA
jgi:hypothetical protein